MENEKESVKVLIVDDEQDIRTLLNIYLKRLGYDVVEAADGVEAVETCLLYTSPSPRDRG